MNESTTTTTMISSVYVHPKQFIFYADNQQSFSQVATLFNPFEFLIKFKVLSTAPTKYLVTDHPTGFLKPKCSIDFTVKHHGSAFIQNENENVSDKLRIQIYSAASKSNNNDSNNNDYPLIGKKDLLLHSVTHRELFFAQRRDDEKNSISSTNNNVKKQQQQRIISNGGQTNNQQQSLYQDSSVSYLVIFVGLACLVIMFLPITGTGTTSTTINDSDSFYYITLWTKFANVFHISFEIKLFAAFVLGMITMVILKV